jgi:hypothetical protein
MNWDASFLFDSELGGRAEALQAVRPELVVGAPFQWGSEIIYLAALMSFGWFGLGAFAIGLLMPLLTHVLAVVPGARTQYKRSLAAGLLIYLFASFSDGALPYIPVMAFYWLVVGLLLSPLTGTTSESSLAM